LKELDILQNLMQHASIELDCSKGILQAIGFKEFAPYLAARDNGMVHFFLYSNYSNSQSGKPIAEIEVALKESVDALKRRNRTYARTQLGWIEHHFRSRLPLYRLSSTNLNQWVELVHAPALQIVKGKH
jgi:tRNA A37 N6-isopentenylltransferase MiaA